MWQGKNSSLSLPCALGTRSVNQHVYVSSLMQLSGTKCLRQGPIEGKANDAHHVTIQPGKAIPNQHLHQPAALAEGNQRGALLLEEARAQGSEAALVAQEQSRKEHYESVLSDLGTPSMAALVLPSQLDRLGFLPFASIQST